MSKERDVRQRMLETASKLLQSTLAGVITWTDTDVNDQYLYTGSNASVLIDWFPEGRFEMTLLNSRGTVAEKLGADQSTEDPFEDNNLYSLLERLYEAARRSALQIDDLLDGLTRDIESGYNSGKEDPPF